MSEPSLRTTAIAAARAANQEVANINVPADVLAVDAAFSVIRDHPGLRHLLDHYYGPAHYDRASDEAVAELADWVHGDA